MKYIVALTGGMGSGKSTTSTIFAQFGIDVIDADIIARKIVAPNTLALHILVTHFGNNILNSDGTLNRRDLSKRVFTNSTEKQYLESILHPLIYQETQRQILHSSSPYVLWVVPLLFEKNLINKVNRILVMDVLPQIQLQRIIARDKISRKHAKLILASQVPRQWRISMADDIIDNNGPIDYIPVKVAYLHKFYTILASQKNQ